MKYCEIIADNLNKAGSSLGWVSALDSAGRTIWIADAHRDDGGSEDGDSCDPGDVPEACDDPDEDGGECFGRPR